MDSQGMILEKLGYQKLFKEEIKAIWKALISSKNSSKDVTIRPKFYIFTREDFIDLPSIKLYLPYKWDLKTCGMVKKIDNFLIFGIDVSKIDIDISESTVREVIKGELLYSKYPSRSVGTLLVEKHETFYSFCKNVLNKSDDDAVSLKDTEAFFDTELFNDKIVRKAMELCETGWNLNKPLIGNSPKVGEDIIPILYYNIPRREYCYLIRVFPGSVWGQDIKLDLRTLSSKDFITRDIENISKYKILVGIPRRPIQNDFYHF